MVTNDTHHFRNNTGSNMPSKNINSNQNSSSKKETFPVKIDNGAECDVDLKDLLKPDFALDGIDEAGQEEINIQK